MSDSSLLNDLKPFSTTSRSRLQSLYSAFDPQRHSNPSSYNANVDWWRQALEALTSATGSLTLKADAALLQSLRIPGVGKPLSLGAVVSDLQQTHALIPRATFLTAPRSIYDPASLPTRIVTTLVGRPIWWALEHLGVVGEDGFLYSTSLKGTQWFGDYVILSLVEQAADIVTEVQMQRDTGAPGDRLYTRDTFRRTFGSALKPTTAGEGLIKEDDAEVLLRYLERDRGLIIVDQEVIKFLSSKDAPPEERNVTAVDRGILELKSAVGNMHIQIEAIQLKINECTKKISSALNGKHKNVALTHLRSRKQLETLLGQRLGSLETLEATCIRVEAAAGDVVIMKAYEQSTATLRTILAHPALQRGHIDKTMDALAEASADAHDVDEAIRVGADVALGIGEVPGMDESELEDELKALVDEMKIEGSNLAAETGKEGVQKIVEGEIQTVEGEIQTGEGQPSGGQVPQKERVPVAA